MSIKKIKYDFMISVCIATYNGEKYIKEQLDSILLQLNFGDEIIISDDGSTDRTLSIIESYNDSRITIYKNSFKNVVLNFEFAIKMAKGEYIFLSDQDDIWHKNKVSTYMDVFINNPNLILLMSDLQIIDKCGNYLDRVFFKKGFRNGFLDNIVANNFIGCAMAFTNSVKSQVLPFPKNIAMHDWWIGTCSIFLGDIGFINEKLNFYRRHDNNVTKDVGENLIKRLRWRINLVWNLFLRYNKIKFNSE